MVSVVSGNGLGLANSSRSVIGLGGEWFQPVLGRSGERVTVNAATGNLVVQNRDGLLAGLGDDIALLRTYNSRGGWDGDNADGWRLAYYRRIGGLTGTLGAAGSSLKRTEADGFESTYVWRDGRYVSTDGAGAYDSIAVNADGSLTWTDGDTGTTETYLPDPADSSNWRLGTVTDTEGHHVRIGYDAGGLISTLAHWPAGATSAGETVTLVYDAQRRLTQVDTRADGGTTTRVRYTYDAAGRLAGVTTDLSPEDGSIADGRVYCVTYTYDDQGRLRTLGQTDGSLLTIDYDSAGRVRLVTDALGRSTSVSYDDATRTTTVTDPLSQATRFVHDTQGRLVQVSGAVLGNTSANPALTQQYSYDADGNLLSVTDPQQRTTTYTYHTRGNLLRRTDAAGQVLERRYDTANRLVAEVAYTVPDPDGAGPGEAAGALTTQYLYDTGSGGDTGQRRLRFVISAEGRITEHRYDSRGLPASTTLYAASRWTAGSATLATLTDWLAARSVAERAAVQHQTYTYDLRGQLASTTRYSGTSTSGSTVTFTGPATTTYTYDPFGRLLQTRDADGRLSTQAYDGLDRLLLSTDAAGATTLYSHDDAGRTTTVQLASPDGVQPGLRTVSTYDSAGQLLSQAQFSGTVPLGQTRYAYDAAGRLRMSTDPTGQRRWWVYDEAGREVARIDPLGHVTETTYDAAGRVVLTTAYARAVDTTALVDAQGQPVDVRLGGLPLQPGSDDRRQWLAYDAAGRLVYSVAALGEVSETRYDGAGRVVAQVQYARRLASLPAAGGTLSASAVATSLASDPADRLTRHFYDADGRQRATLDAEGYLVEQRYDQAGRLVERIAYTKATTAGLRATGTLTELLSGLASADNAVAGAASFDRRSLWWYDGQGRVILELDAEGQVTEHTYSAAGLRTQTLRYAQGLTPAAAAALTPTSAPASARPAGSAQDRSTSWTHDGLGRIATETGPDGTVTAWTYDAQGRLTRTDRALGTLDVRSTRTRYDAQGRVTAELSANGAALLVPGQTQEQVDAIWAQHATTHQYDDAGRRIRSTDATGHSTVFYYDAAGRLSYSIRLTAQGGEVEALSYTAFGEVAATRRYTNRLATSGLALPGGLATPALEQMIAALAHTTDARSTLAYNQRGQVQQAIDALGFSAEHSYDAFGQVQQTRREVGSTPSGSAPADGRVLRTDLTYDRRGLLTTTVQDPATLAVTTRTEYDAFGRITAEVDALGRRSIIEYLRGDGSADSGRQVVITDALGAARRTTYDAFDREIRRTDALGHVTRIVHDDALRRVTVTTPEGIRTVTETNRHGQVVQLIDGTGAATQFAYDADGREITRTDALGQVTRSSYDAAGRLVLHTPAGQASVRTTFDAAGRVLTRQVDPDGLNLTTRYQYDGQGRAVQVTDAAGTVTSYRFDAQGQLVQTVVDDRDGGLRLTTLTAYDAQGRVLTVTEGAGTAAAKTTQYQYDLLGRRTAEIVDPAGLRLVTSYRYDAAGQLVLRHDAQGHPTRHVYDAGGRLRVTVNAAGEVTEQRYDAEGRLVATQRYARRLLDNDAVRVWYQAGSNSSVSRSLGSFEAGDVVTATVRYQADRPVSGAMFLGDAGGADPYDNHVYTGAVYGRPEGDGWHNLTLTLTLTHTDSLWVYLYGDRDGANAQAGHSVLYDWVKVESARRGTVLNEGFEGSATYGGNTVGSPGTDWSLSSVLAERVQADVDLEPLRLGDAQILGALAGLADAGRDQVTRWVYDADGRQRFAIDAEGGVKEQRHDAAGRVVASLHYARRLQLSDAPTEAELQAATRSVTTTFASRLEGFDGPAGVWDAGRLKLVSQPLSDGSWASTYSPNALPPGSSFKFDLTPNELQQALHVGVTSTGSGPYARVAALFYPDGMVRAQTYDASIGTWAYTDLGTYTAGTTYTVEVVTTETGATLYVYAKGGSRSSGYAYTYATAPGNAWTQVRLFFATRTHPNLAGITTAHVDNVEERAADAQMIRYVYDAAGRMRFTVDAEGYVSEQRYDAAGRVVASMHYARRLQLSDTPTEAELQAATRSVTTTFASGLEGFDGPAGVWDAGRLKLVSQPLSGGSWASTYSPNALPPGSSFKFDLTPNELQQTLHVGVTSTGSSPSARVAALFYPDGTLRAQTYDASIGTWAYADLGTYTAGTTYTVEVVTTGTGATLYVYAKGGSRSSGYAYTYATATGNAWTQVRLFFATQTYPWMVGVTTAHVDNIEEGAADARVTHHVYDAAGRLRFEVDAEGYVTERQFDALGRVTATIRHTARVSLTEPPTLAQLEAATTYTNTFDSGVPGFTGPADSWDSGRMLLTSRPEAGGTWATSTGTRRLPVGSSLRFDLTPNQLQQTLHAGAHSATDSPGGRLVVLLQPDGTLQVQTWRDGAWAYAPLGTYTPGVAYTLEITTSDAGAVLYFYPKGQDRAAGYIYRSAPGEMVWTAFNTYFAVRRSPSLAGQTTAHVDNLQERTATVATQTYDAAGRLITSVDAEGVVTRHEYDAVGRETRRTVAAGLPEASTTTWAYDAAGRKLNETLAAGTDAASTTRWRYDGNGRLMATIDPRGVALMKQNTAWAMATRQALGYPADATTLSAAQQAALAQRYTTRYGYDAAGRLTTQIDAEGGITLTRYDALGNANRTRDPRGNTTYTTYDKLNRAIQQVDAGGYLTTNTYDAFGNLTDTRRYAARVVRPEDGAVTILPPGSSAPAWGAYLIEDPAQTAHTHFEYDRRNQATLTIDAEGYAQSAVYDAFGQRISSTRYATPLSQAARDALARAGTAAAAASITTDAARDATTRFEYDRRGALTRRTDAEAITGTSDHAYEAWTYDAFGNRTAWRNQAGAVTTYRYDARGLLVAETRPITTRNAAGAAIAVVNRHVYDALGTRVRLVEAEGSTEQRSTDYEYDRLGRLTVTRGQPVTTWTPGAGGSAGSYAYNAATTTINRYDPAGNLVEQVDANGGRTRAYFDALNRKIAEVNAAGILSTWQRDAAGNVLVQRVHADPVTIPAELGGLPPAPTGANLPRETRFAYDALNRQLEASITGLELRRYTTAADGSLVESAASEARIRNSFDAAGNLVKTIDANGGVTLRWYDRNNRKVLEIDAAGYGIAWLRNADGSVQREVRFARAYPNAAALSETSAAAALLAAWPADPADRITEFSYDRAGRLLTETRLNVAHGSVDALTGRLSEATGSATRRYAYDALGHKTRETDPTGAQTDWFYDAAGRLLRHQGAAFTDHEGTVVRATTDYEYDGLNNITRVIRRGKNDSSEADDRIQQFGYGAGGRLLTQTDAEGNITTLDYDAAGNVTLRRMVRRDADGSAVTEATAHTYDALNREVRRQNLRQAGALAAGTPATGTWQAGDHFETRYNAWGEVTGRRTNGGNAAGEWHEYAEYNALGKVQKTNAGNGITKVHLYDANGNATLSFESAGANLRSLSLAQVLASAATHRTVTQYDARNQVVAVHQSAMDSTRTVLDVQQTLAEQARNFAGGSGQVTGLGTLLGTAPSTTQAPPLTDAQRFQVLSTHLDWAPRRLDDGEGGYVEQGVAVRNLIVNLPVQSIGQVMGGWTSVLVRVDYTLEEGGAGYPLTGSRSVTLTDAAAQNAVLALNLNAGLDARFSYTVSVTYQYPGGVAPIQVARSSGGGQLSWQGTVQVSDGEGGYFSQVQQMYGSATAADISAFRTEDLARYASIVPPGNIDIWQDRVGADAVSAAVNWTTEADESGVYGVLVDSITVNLPTASLVETFRKLGTVTVYVDYALGNGALLTREVGVSSASTTAVTFSLAARAGVGDVNFRYNVRVVRREPPADTAGVLVASTPVVSQAIAWTTTTQVSDGEGGYYPVTTQNFASSTAFNRSFATETANRTWFIGAGLTQATDALLYYRTSATGPYTAVALQRALSGNGSLAASSFYVPNSALPAGIVDYRIVTLGRADGSTNTIVRGSFAGSAIAASVAINSPGISPAGEVLFDNTGAMQIIGQNDAANSTPRLAIQYRRTGSTDAWAQQELSAVRSGGWFRWPWQAAGLSGPYDVRILRLDNAGNVRSRLFTQATLSATPTATALAPYVEPDLALHNQPDSAVSLTFEYALEGTGAWRSVSFTRRGSGVFGLSMAGLDLALLPTGDYKYDYRYKAMDATGQVVNSAAGLFTINGQGGRFDTHVNTARPTVVSFVIEPQAAVKMDLRYRELGSTGSYATTTLTRASNEVPFRWDASLLLQPNPALPIPTDRTVTYEYEYTLRDAAGQPVLNPLGQPIVVRGTAVLGQVAQQAPAATWVSLGSVNTRDTIVRRQAWNAFGEIASETDGRGYTTTLTYNTLGLLVRKEDPQTDVTGEDGLTTRLRPRTDLVHDLAGRQVAERDANGFVTTRTWIDTAQGPQVATEFQPINRAQSALATVVRRYDSFGNLRSQTDPLGRVTRYSYDRLDRLTRLDRPVRTDGQHLAGQAAWETYDYDSAGQRIATTTVLGRSRLYYDQAGRITRSTSALDQRTEVTYAWDATVLGAGSRQVGGWVRTTALPDGSRLAVDRSDVFGRLTWHQDYGGHATTYAYNHAGWLTAQTSTFTVNGITQAGQNLAFEYYANGFLKQQTDLVTRLQSSYAYDANGNRVQEQVRRTDDPLAVYQSSTVSYDELNRVRQVVDPTATITYRYDAVGNRRNVHSYYQDGLDGRQKPQDLWYLYDAMNRFVITQGELKDGRIQRGSGKLIAYNLAGERVSAEYNLPAPQGQDTGPLVRETYTYTSDGYLQDVLVADWNGSAFVARGHVSAARQTDLAGRVLRYTDRNAAGTILSDLVREFDADGRQTKEVNYAQMTNGLARTQTYRYNADGTLGSVAVTNAETNHTLSYTYLWRDSALQAQIRLTPQNASVPGWADGVSLLSYDVNGHLQQATDVDGQRTITYVTNADGQILARQEVQARPGVPSDWRWFSSSDHSLGGEALAGTVTRRRYYYLSGQRIGDVSNDTQPPNQIDYAVALAQSKAAEPTRYAPVAYADFDANYQAINETYPAASATQYTVQGSETLRGIAQRVWGDASLWYLIAEANGLSGSEDLPEGMRLTIPNKVTNVHNNSTTVRPYDPGEAIGDTSPTLPPPPPPPQAGGCGAIGMVLMVVVAVVVTVYTAGAAAGMMSVATGATTTMGAGMAVLSGGAGLTASAVGAAAIGGAVGSMASQVAGLATGTIDKFSWKAVGQSALGSAVTAGVGSAINQAGIAVLQGAGEWASAGRAAISSGVNQALHTDWNWQEVLASAAGAGAGAAVGNALGAALGSVGARLAGGFAGGVIGAWAGPGGKADYGSTLASSLGNVIGDGIVDAALPRQGVGPWSDKDYRNGADIQSDNHTAPPVGSGLRVDPATAATWGLRQGYHVQPEPLDYSKDGSSQPSQAVHGADQSPPTPLQMALLEAGHGPIRAEVAQAGLDWLIQNTDYRSFLAPSYDDQATAMNGTPLGADRPMTPTEVRVMGGIKAVGGATGMVTSPSLGPVGIPVAAYAADALYTGLYELANGEPRRSVIAQGLELAGMSPEWADGVTTAGGVLTAGLGAYRAVLPKGSVPFDRPWYAMGPNDGPPLPPALQQARDLHRLAARAESDVTPTLQSIAETNGGTMVGLEHRLKTVESMARKIEAQPQRPINDALRYTMTFDEAGFTPGVRGTMERLDHQGYTLVKVWNQFKDGVSYKGINATYQTPDGLQFEVQFHTPASFEMKQVTNHRLYEQQRLLPKQDPLFDQLNQEMIRNSGTVQTPAGASSIRKPR